MNDNECDIVDKMIVWSVTIPNWQAAKLGAKKAEEKSGGWFGGFFGGSKKKKAGKEEQDISNVAYVETLISN